MPATATTLNPRYVESDKLAAIITELFAYITAATHQFLTLVAEFDEKEYWKLCGVHTCAHWLNWQCGIGMNAAREKVRVARALQGLPKIDKAFARGEISYSKVRAITRAANPENEDYLLMFARHGTAHHVEKLIAGSNRVKRIRSAENDTENLDPQASREVSTRWDEDGCLVVTARLPAEAGAMLLKAMELAMDRQFKEVGMMPEIAMRRADALAEMAEAYLNNEAPKGSSGDRYQAVIHITADNSRFDRMPDPVNLNLPCPDDHGGVKADETARRIACDCSLVPMIKGIKGEPLSVGRKTRSIPPAILRALHARDGGCRFPGCTNSRFVDGHHIRHWADGGETSLKNLVLLCRHHHGLVHEGGFGCELSANGSVVFKSPRGPGALGANVIPVSSEMTAPDSVQAPVRWLSEEIDCKHVDKKTCVTRWAGEKCDWPLAVGHLFPESVYLSREP